MGEETPAISNAIAQMTAAAGPQSSREPRPNIALPTDGSSQKYMLGDGKDCLNLDLDMDPRCWVALILDEWLPAWVRSSHHIVGCGTYASIPVGQDPKLFEQHDLERNKLSVARSRPS